MGQLSKPIMSPVGVVYRCLHESEAHALKSAQWAVKLFGGSVTNFNIIGPGKSGMFEAAVMNTVPPGTACAKGRKNADISWFGEQAHAYVLYNDLETPLVLYFFKHEVLLKPSLNPPMYAFHEISLEQW
jgi:hypothetical protein